MEASTESPRKNWMEISHMFPPKGKVSKTLAKNSSKREERGNGFQYRDRGPSNLQIAKTKEKMERCMKRANTLWIRR